MQRDVEGVAIISLLFGTFAVIVSGSILGVFIVCLFIAGAIYLLRER